MDGPRSSTAAGSARDEAPAGGPAGRGSRPLPDPVAGGLAFVASAAVLVLEILAVRLIAPYVGLTLEATTGIIATVLAGITVGAWAGGRVADRVPPRDLLAALFVAGGLATLLVVPAVDVTGPVLGGQGALQILTVAAMGFFAPAALLSAIAPTLAKLQLADLRTSGSVVGRLSGLGAAGGIFGTLVTGFVLVAAWPTRLLVLALGAGLVALGLALWGGLRGADRGVLGVAVVTGALTLASDGPCDRETRYFCARVVADGSQRELVLDRLRHAHVDLRNPRRLEFPYARVLGRLVDSLAAPGAPLRVLHVGGGGFTLPRYVAASRPGSLNRVLELDPGVVDIARDRLGLRPGPRLTVRTGDARLALPREPARFYDVAIGDAFGGAAVPWHLTTLEFLTEIKRALRPRGVYAMNVIDLGPARFARAQVATLRRAFAHVVAIGPPGFPKPGADGNFVLIASDRPLDTVSLQWRLPPELNVLLTAGPQLDAWARGAPVLTDDHAPVDQLLTPPDFG